MSSFTKILPCVLVFLVVGHANAQLRSDFYKKSCGNVFDLVRPVLEEAVRKEARMAASILRLHFHDCFVNGCDGSILLDDTSSFTGEKSAGPNQNSIRGFEVIDAIKTAVEKACPGVVSCADILTIAARDSVVLSNGPSWEVKLGRRDSTTASLDDANRNIPVPSSTVNQLISRFRAQGLSARDMVALSGAHTIGKARCTTNNNERYAKFVSRRCPASGGDDNLSPLDVGSATRFDNGYFQNLKCEKGLLHSDQVLQSGGSSTASIVDAYSNNPSAFYKDFIQAMIKMGNNKPLTGYDGQIRRNCRIVN